MYKKMSLITMLLLVAFSLSFQQSTLDAKAGSKFPVKLIQCIDGDTAKFSKVGVTRFLYVDTPESTNELEAFGEDAASFTCEQLTKASRIELQFDGPLKDKYKRTLAWVWVDGKLLQSLLIQNGYVEKFYDYGQYSYEADLIKKQDHAKKTHVGMWSKNKSKEPKPNTSKYRNCEELRRVYKKGVPSTHPAYNPSLDRDKDNFACER